MLLSFYLPLIKLSFFYRMLPSDAKSQNSDYGSFCHTPSDTFGNNSQTTTGGSGSGTAGNGAGSPDHLDHGGGAHG